MSVVRSDKERGALWGLAVGDALGAAVEFQPPGSFEPVTGYRAGAPHRLEAGEWTDDTAMALALASSVGTVGWDLADQVHRYLDWWHNGAYSVTGRCFDIGDTTRVSLARFERTGDPRTSGGESERSAGNGSIMRLAPVPVAYRTDGLDRVIALSVESSLPTHRAPQTISRATSGSSDTTFPTTCVKVQERGSPTFGRDLLPAAARSPIRHPQDAGTGSDCSHTSVMTA